jgi:two-component system OmpR family sensor kinase
VRSLRSRLLVWLLSALALGGIAAGVATYFRAQRDLDALLDYQLQQLAFSLGQQRPAQIVPQPFLEEPDFVTQIWDHSGVLLYYSRPDFWLPLRVQAGFSNAEWRGETWRVYTQSDGLRTIRVAHPLRLRREMAASLARRAVGPLALLMPVLAATIWFGVARALRPLEELSADLRSRSASALAPIEANALPDEIQPLIASLNDLLARLERALELQREFLADAAHELRTPLTAVQVQLQVLERAATEEDRQLALSRLEQGVRRSTRLVQQLLALARQEPDRLAAPMQSVDLLALVRHAVDDFAQIAPRTGLVLELEAEPCSVRGDAEGLRVMVNNLLDNAMRYTPAGGSVRVALRPERDGIVLRVADTGPGIPPGERERVFERFYRGAAADSDGSGLGLAIVKRVAERHRGRVELEDGPNGRGLTVVVHLADTGGQRSSA